MDHCESGHRRLTAWLAKIQHLALSQHKAVPQPAANIPPWSDWCLAREATGTGTTARPDRPLLQASRLMHAGDLWISWDGGRTTPAASPEAGYRRVNGVGRKRRGRVSRPISGQTMYWARWVQVIALGMAAGDRSGGAGRRSRDRRHSVPAAISMSTVSARQAARALMMIKMPVRDRPLLAGHRAFDAIIGLIRVWNRSGSVPGGAIYRLASTTRGCRRKRRHCRRRLRTELTNIRSRQEKRSRIGSVIAGAKPRRLARFA